MSELILELFSEEIPASMQSAAELSYFKIFTKHLNANNITFDHLQVFSGARRLSVHVVGLPKCIAAKVLTIKGPRVGTSAHILSAFCRAQAINAEQLTTEQISGQLFYTYQKSLPKTDLSMLLLLLLPVIIKEHKWPTSMRWGDYHISWVRPLKNIMCLFDSTVLPIKFGHLTANGVTYGHRFMAPVQIGVKNFADYQQQLAKKFVILSRCKRQQIICKQLHAQAAKERVFVKEDIDLLNEVTGLSEWPVAMIGKIPKKFLTLPQEVLISAMRVHQKYFSTLTSNGDFAPYFLFISNLKAQDPQLIIRGNEKVLAARLADAWYFYEQDLNTGLKAMGDKLKAVIFHQQLGSIEDKVQRISKICQYLAPDKQELQTAAKICKNDLVSQMVAEFPELQGVIGYYYALAANLDEQVALAIKDHYKPLKITCEVPTGFAALLALSDKLDSLVGLMLTGEAPTGSSDQYALRRTALAIIRIILANNLSLDIGELINFSAKCYGLSSTVNILLFIEERAKFYFKEHYAMPLINAVLDLTKEPDLLKTKLKLATLQDFLKQKSGQELIISYKRVSNIVSGKLLTGKVNKSHLIKDAEQKLFNSLVFMSERVRVFKQNNDFLQTLECLAALNILINNFFDNVLVNDPNLQLANNRVLLLQEVLKLFAQIAKFDQL